MQEYDVNIGMRHISSIGTFISQSLKHFIKVGSFLPSSVFLARRMAKRATGPIVVELGPGTGVVTKEILKVLPSNGTLICIESNAVFTDHLKRNICDERVTIYEGDASMLNDFLKKKGIQKVNCVISGLPLGNFKKNLKRNILEKISDCLENDGVFMQFEYLLAGMAAVKEVFPLVSLEYEFLNIPPAFVMKCKKVLK